MRLQRWLTWHCWLNAYTLFCKSPPPPQRKKLHECRWSFFTNETVCVGTLRIVPFIIWWLKKNYAMLVATAVIRVVGSPIAVGKGLSTSYPHKRVLCNNICSSNPAIAGFIGWNEFATKSDIFMHDKRRRLHCYQLVFQVLLVVLEWLLLTPF